jgi:hypothetical protein
MDKISIPVALWEDLQRDLVNAKRSAGGQANKVRRLTQQLIEANKRIAELEAQRLLYYLEDDQEQSAA